MKEFTRAVLIAAFVGATGFASMRQFSKENRARVSGPPVVEEPQREPVKSVSGAVPGNVTVVRPSGGGGEYRLDPSCDYPVDGEHPAAYYINGAKPRKKSNAKVLEAGFNEKVFGELTGAFQRDGHVHQFVDKLYRSPGTFIESGAHDGCRESHTIWLESRKGWQGVLIEANPGLFSRLEKLKRNAWGFQACLPIKPGVHSAEFAMHGALGGIVDTLDMGHVTHIRKYAKESPEVDSGSHVTATCVPIHSILQHASIPLPITLWILDVEGAEVPVLTSTFATGPPPAKLIVIEHNANPERRDAIHGLLSTHNYYRFMAEHMDDWYVHKDHCQEIGKCFEWPVEYISAKYGNSF
eukprot:TRINITY_DN5674_c0_g3_i1.p1 TRINITY_DN5674_c0_g3~~TRINITY_DN5674_c0_g3_i1.p1  ORF type:complete len:353 (+),score=19.60 TRINITY_DN5674_c0_g3_i1:73-1131(+)